MFTCIESKHLQFLTTIIPLFVSFALILSTKRQSTILLNMNTDFALPNTFKLLGIFLGLFFSMSTACTVHLPIGSSQANIVKPRKILDDMQVVTPDTPYNKLVVEYQNDLLKEEFAAIEKKAFFAIKNKERIEGGSWKIRAISDALDNPVKRMSSSEDDWQKHFARIENWKKQFPNSITAYTALSSSYTNYGQQARGEGYASTVSAEDAELSQQRFKQAQNVLEEAAELKEKSPVYYEELLVLGMSRGISLNQFNEIFNEAIEFEPEYQYFYRQKAMFLLPRWHGKPGDWEDFAEETMNSIGGKKGAEMYYQIVANISRLHGPEYFQNNRINWVKTVEGFDEFEKNYGMSREKLNEFGRLAINKGDLPTACKVFKRLGADDYDEDVWKKETFRGRREIALRSCKDPS